MPQAIIAPGLLLSAIDDLPRLDAEGARIRIAPVPDGWESKSILEFFAACGFTTRVDADSLNIAGRWSPSESIERAAVILFALDPVSRAERALMLKAQALADKFDEALVELLADRGGARRLRKLLGQERKRPDDSALTEAIVSALQKIQTSSVVHFDCDGGRIIRAITETLQLSRAVGVEASESRSGRSRHGFELLHGSVVEPPSGLPTNATALVVEALPPSGDIRLDRAAETLFGSKGFEWILCIEERSDLADWAKHAAKNFGYKMASWRLDRRQGVMFRRVKKIDANPEPRMEPSREIRPRVGPTVRIESWKETLEAFSKLTVDPRWLMYLPADTATLQSDQMTGPLEDAKAIFEYYRSERIEKLVLEESQRGPRTVAVICRDEDAALRRFGIFSLGCLYTKTGRPLLPDPSPFLRELSDGLTRANLWEQMKTDWVCLEGETLPWTLKGAALLDEELRLLGAGEAMYQRAAIDLKIFVQKGIVPGGTDCFAKYRAIVGRYSQHKAGPLTFLPSRIIATEGKTHFDRSNLWHLQTLGGISRRAGGTFREKSYKVFSLDHTDEVRSVLASLKDSSAYVFKPLPILPKGKRGFAQPAFLCRGAEFLRLIHGPQYDLPENRLWLSERSSVTNRRANNRRILRQLVLGIEAAQRFVDREPLVGVEECVRAILAVD
jgi:hypothetical protein